MNGGKNYTLNTIINKYKMCLLGRKYSNNISITILIIFCIWKLSIIKFSISNLYNQETLLKSSLNAFDS